MLYITIPEVQSENWDETNEEFIYNTVSKEQTICLEHSLISLSKWESKWNKPFISSEKTDEEFLDYIKCMTISPNISDDLYDRLTTNNISDIINYINATMTATTFSKDQKKRGINKEIVTSELIYYWMIELKIPVEFEKWHLNRLITLITVCNIKNTPPKKHSKRELMSRNAALNAARRKRFNTKG